MKIQKVICDSCNMLFRPNNLSKHKVSCRGNAALSWYVRKANNMLIKTYNTAESVDWKSVQQFYDEGKSTADVVKEFKLTFTVLSKAGKQGLFTPRKRIETARMRGLDSRGKVKSQEEKDKISTSMKKAVLEGRQKTPKPYGRNSIEYKGFTLQSTWELTVAQHLDEFNIQWTRPQEGHLYEFEGKQHLYFPDFHLTDHNIYIEVKGWVQPKDLCKWRDFKHKLIIIDRKTINKLAIHDMI
jgi:hypothetical protein